MEGMTFKGIDSSGQYIKDACEKSLTRLNVEYIDLCKSLISHDVSPIVDTR
jgi:aryl-alcohol dehydrogenase-like predicted oxidoreductase